MNIKRTNSMMDDTEERAAEEEVKTNKSRKKPRQYKHPDVQSQASINTVKSTRGIKLPESVQNKMKQTSKMSKSKEGVADMLSSKLKQMEGVQFVCGICQCNYSFKDKTCLADCKHAFCDSCLNHYAIYKVGRFEEVLCPAEDCERPMLLTGDFFVGLPKETKDKAKKVMAFYQTLKDPNLRLCPNEKCESGVLNMASQEQTVYCEACEREFCRKCLFPTHEGECDKNEVDFFEKNLRYRQCIKCKMVIEKSEGCRRMKCRCGYEFCYVCGIKWPGYQHQHTPEEEFGVNGNPPVPYVPPPPPEGCALVLEILRIIFWGFPWTIIFFCLLTALHLVFIGICIYLHIIHGICKKSCELCEKVPPNCFLLIIIFLPFFLVGGILWSFGEFFIHSLPQIWHGYCQKLAGIKQWCLTIR